MLCFGSGGVKSGVKKRKFCQFLHRITKATMPPLQKVDDDNRQATRSRQR